MRAIVAIALVALLAAAPAARASSITDQLWGFWRFDSDFSDASGQGHALTSQLQGIATPVQIDTATKVAGAGAASFGGVVPAGPGFATTGNYLQSTAFPGGSSPSLTLAAWFNVDTRAADLGSGIMGVGAAASGQRLFMRAVGIDSSRFPGFDGNPHLNFTAEDGSDTWQLGSAVTSEDTWYHAVLTYDGATKTYRSYVNGVLDRSRTVSATLNLASGLRLGGDAYNDNFLDGWIDSAATWTRALSGTEVAALYAAGGDPLAAGAVPEPGLAGLAAMGIAAIARRTRARSG